MVRQATSGHFSNMSRPSTRTHSYSRSHTRTNARSRTKWGRVGGYYGNRVKVAGEFLLHCRERQRHREVKSERESERKKKRKNLQLPEDLVFLNLGSKQPHRNQESKNEAKTLINQTESKLLMWEKRHWIIKGSDLFQGPLPEWWKPVNWKAIRNENTKERLNGPITVRVYC